MTYNVKPITKNEIKHIAQYWKDATKESLLAMGADITKMPSYDHFTEMLTKQISLPIEEKPAYALIWYVEGNPIGHCNLNNIKYGEEAFLHLHIWHPESRKKGIGQILLKKSIAIFFDHLKLKKLFSEPYALNPAPNKTLQKSGFTFVKKHTTIPGYINFKQEVNRYVLRIEDL